MDIFEQARKASPKDLKKVLKTAGKDATKRTNDKGQTLIHTAAEGGNHEGLKLLLTKYKLAHFVNIKDGLGGWTPLHYAAEGGHLECIDLLIHHGADVTATSRDGDSALHYLVRAKGLQSDTAHYYKLLKTILNTRGVDVNAQNMNGESALHLSAIGGHDEVANLLLNHSADIDLKSRKGETALHYATRYGNADIVTTLLERNADPLVSGTDGTPYSIASRDQQRKDIAELLSTAQAGRLQRKNTAPLSSGRRSSATVIEDNAATSLSTNSAPMPAVSYSPKPLPPVPRSTSFDTNGHQEGPHQWSIESLPSVDCLLRSCHVALSPRVAPSSSSSSSSPSPYSPQQSPALLLSSFLGQVDAALASRAQRPPGSLNYDFTYERDILTHVEKERETLRIVEERRKEFEERNNLAARAAFSPAAGSDSPYVASSVMTGSGPHPVYHIPPVETPMAAMQPQPGMMTPPYHVGGYPQQQPFMHPPTTTTPTPTAMATRPPMHAAYSSPGGLTAEFRAAAAGGPPHAPVTRPPGSGSGSGPHAGSLASSEPHILHHKGAHPLHVSRPKSGSTGDLSRNHGNALKSPRGGVAVLPPLPHSGPAADSNRRPRSNSARQSTPFNHAQETLYLKVISEHEELNTENVHLAVKHCGNDPKSVIAYVKAYERVKPMGYSQAHVVEALKAYGGGAPGLSPQEEDRQHQRMVAFLKLLVNKGFSPAPQVQNALSLFDYDVDKAEKFLSAYKTVSQMGFSDVQVREALLLSDSDSEQAIRYLLEGK